MVVTITMNPAIDKTIEITELLKGGLNRIRSMEYDAGGKGINVSKTLHEIGGESIATGFLAGNSGKIIEEALKEKGIQSDFVWVDGETRTNTKVLEDNGTVTELNEPGVSITEEQMELLMKKIESYAGEDTLFVLSGSIPQGVPKDTYKKIIQLAHSRQAKVLLDADGEIFREAVEAAPDMIKPNRVELEEYAKLESDASEEELQKIAQRFLDKGIQTIAISMGKDGAMFVEDHFAVRCPAIPINGHSSVGAGDAMVAALAYSWDKKLDRKEKIRLCMAVSAGAVMTVGTKPPSKAVVEELKKKVTPYLLQCE